MRESRIQYFRRHTEASNPASMSHRASWRGPWLRAFLLLAAMQVVGLLCEMIVGLVICDAVRSILQQFDKHRLQFETSLHQSFVCLRLSLRAHHELSLHALC